MRLDATQYRVWKSVDSVHTVERNEEATYITLPDGNRAYIPSDEFLQSTDGFVKWLTEWVDL